MSKRKPLYTFERFVDESDEYRWRARHRNGNIIATSGESYKTRSSLARSLVRFIFGIKNDNYETAQTKK